MSKRNTKSWKHTCKAKKQYHKYGFIDDNIRTKETDFMSGVDSDIWAEYMAYDNTDDGVEEE